MCYSFPLPFSPTLFSYVTGKSVETNEKFNQAHPEVSQVRALFHEWLQTAYSKFLSSQSFHG